MNSEKIRLQVNQCIADHGLIAVIRLDSAEKAVRSAEALIQGGVRILEVTMTTPGATDVIQTLRRKFLDRVCIGAGTVLNEAQCLQVLGAGAQFIVSPIGAIELVKSAHGRGCPVMLGAFSPTECMRVFEAGADFAKIFPGESLGPNYIKSLLAPLPFLSVVPTGGVDLQTAPAFIQAGCIAVGAGGTLILKELVSQSRWDDLASHACKFQEVVSKALEGRKKNI